MAEEKKTTSDDEIKEAIEEMLEEEELEAKTATEKEADKEEEETESESVDANKDAKKSKKDNKDELIEDLTDKVKRQMAEFENFRNRSEKEKSQMYEIGAKSTLEKLLPIVDNFERGLDNIPEGSDDAFVEGMNMIYKQLMTTLDELGVKEIEAAGKEFDPELHNAVMHVEDESFGENEVAEVLQKGYMYKESVLRHSMVKVAN